MQDRAPAKTGGGQFAKRSRHVVTAIVRLNQEGADLAAVLDELAQIAQTHGSGIVELHGHGIVQIPGIKPDDVAAVEQSLVGLRLGEAAFDSHETRVSACRGCPRRAPGLANPKALAQTIREATPGRELRVGISGCPNDCAMACTRDIAVLGAVRPRLNVEVCTGCRACEAACLEGAIVCDPETGEPTLDLEKCTQCGDCIRCCPTDAWVADEVGWTLSVGGKLGRHPVMARPIATFLSDEAVVDAVVAITNWHAALPADERPERLGTLLQDESAWREFLSAVLP